jgi:DNA-binding transcriptional ArsR family regulator
VTNASRILTALGDPTRQAIVEHLEQGGPTPVNEIAAALPVSRPAVSQHLKVLKDVGLVLDHRVGTRRVYQLDPQGLAILRTRLDQFWERSLEAYQQSLEQEEP